MLRTWPASGPRPYLVKYVVMSYFIVYTLNKVKNKLRTFIGSISRKVKKPEARSICSCSYIKKRVLLAITTIKYYYCSNSGNYRSTTACLCALCKCDVFNMFREVERVKTGYQ